MGPGGLRLGVILPHFLCPVATFDTKVATFIDVYGLTPGSKTGCPLRGESVVGEVY